MFSLCSSVVNRNEWGITSSRYGCTISAKKKGVKFFFKFFFRLGVGAWVWARGCGRVGVGARVWVLGSVGGGGGMEMGGRGMRQAGLGLSLSDVRESPPWASLSRIRIAGSGVIDRPTFRLPFPYARWEGMEMPRSPRSRSKMVGMPLGAHRSL